MTLKLHKTSIFIKIYFGYNALNKDAFPEFCEKLERFPMNKMHPAVKGLNLSGEHYFRRVLFSEIKDVSPKEIGLIKSITPIIDQGSFPYSLELDYFEVNIPAEENSFEELMEAIQIYDKYLDDLFTGNYVKKLEIHPRGGSGKTLSCRIVKEAIPRFVEGKYEYQASIEKQGGHGEIILPTEFSELPKEIKGLVNIIHGLYSLKIAKDNNKFILRPVKRKELGVSLFSDQSEWFRKTLQAFRQANVFDTVIDTKYSDFAPSIT